MYDNVYLWCLILTYNSSHFFCERFTASKRIKQSPTVAIRFLASSVAPPDLSLAKLWQSTFATKNSWRVGGVMVKSWDAMRIWPRAHRVCKHSDLLMPPSGQVRTKKRQKHQAGPGCRASNMVTYRCIFNRRPIWSCIIDVRQKKQGTNNNFPCILILTWKTGNHFTTRTSSIQLLFPKKSGKIHSAHEVLEEWKVVTLA